MLQCLPLRKRHFNIFYKISIQSLRNGICHFDQNYFILLTDYYLTCFPFWERLFLVMWKDPLRISVNLYFTSLLCPMSIYILRNIARWYFTWMFCNVHCFHFDKCSIKNVMLLKTFHEKKSCTIFFKESVTESKAKSLVIICPMAESKSTG